MTFHRAQMRGYGIRQQAIVLVQKDDVLSPRLAKTSVACSSYAAIWLPDNGRPRKSQQKLVSFFRRTVIDHDDLDRWMSLTERTLDRLANVVLPVIVGRDDGDQRRSVRRYLRQ